MAIPDHTESSVDWLPGFELVGGVDNGCLSSGAFDAVLRVGCALIFSA